MQFLLRYSQNQINRILAVFFALTYVNHGCTKPLNGHWNLGTVLFQQQWCQFSSSSTSACQKVLDVQEVKWGAFFALVDPFIQGTAPKYSSTTHNSLITTLVHYVLTYLKLVNFCLDENKKNLLFLENHCRVNWVVVKNTQKIAAVGL